MRILVTGPSGFTGGYVTPLLVEHGHRVTALARSEKAAIRAKELGAEPVTGDLDDPESIDQAFRSSGAEALVNLASLGFGHVPTIIAAAEESGLCRAVFVSTTAIFTKLNARSKPPRLAAEEAIKASALDWTIVRPTMIYGAPGDRNMWRLLQLLRRSPVIPLPGGGRGFQQPVHVEDLARAIVAAVESPAAIGNCYDIAGPEPLPFRQVVEQAAAAVGRRPRLVPVLAKPIIAALAALERIGRAGPIKAEQIERLLEDKAFDITPARKDLGYAPRHFADGIESEATLLGSR